MTDAIQRAVRFAKVNRLDRHIGVCKLERAMRIAPKLKRNKLMTII